MHYDFEWDIVKARSNRKKHRIGFDEAATVFRDCMALTIFDQAHSQAEDRWITIGVSSKGRLLVVCHTFRREGAESTIIRIFSARKASKLQSKQYGG